MQLKGSKLQAKEVGLRAFSHTRKLGLSGECPSKAPAPREETVSESFFLVECHRIKKTVSPLNYPILYQVSSACLVDLVTVVNVLV